MPISNLEHLEMIDKNFNDLDVIGGVYSSLLASTIFIVKLDTDIKLNTNITPLSANYSYGVAASGGAAAGSLGSTFVNLQTYTA